MKHRLAAVILAGLVSALANAQNQPVTVQVDVQASRHLISPLIYGVNLFEDPNMTTTLSDLNAPINRYGGNRASTYNWNLNSDNRGNDNFFESISDDVVTPAGARGDTFITATKGAQSEPMVTIPMLDWIAKAGPNHPFPCSYPLATFPMQFAFDRFEPGCGDGLMPDGMTLIDGADPNLALTPNSLATQQMWMQHILANFKTAAQGGVKYYILDNEHDLWWETHHDAVPNAPHHTDDRDRMFQYAAMIKAQDAGALIAGPEVSGWLGYLLSPADFEFGKLNGFDFNQFPDRNAINGGDYIPWLLGQFQAYELQNNQRLLDVLTVHYYPQGGPNNQNTRSLWDPDYVDPSFINAKIMLIPRMKQWVANNYPGTKIGITEYNWGSINDEAKTDSMSLAVTQADVLGIFGREGLDLATRFNAPPVGLPTYNAMKMYRNYDGNKSTFGDISVVATVPNPDNVAAFAAQRSSDGEVTIMLLSKFAAGDTQVTVNLANLGYHGPAPAWQLSGNGMAIQKIANVVVNNAAFTLSLPPSSVTLVTVPGADFSLAATTPVTTFAGQTVSLAGTLSTASGYGSVVNITCGAGHPQTCGTAAVTPSAAGQPFNIMAGDTVANDYDFNLIAAGTDFARVTHQQPVTLHVVDFGLSQPVPGSLMVGQGNDTPSIAFNALGLAAFTGTVTFSCSGLPVGASCSFAPASATPTANNPAPVTLVIHSGNAATGNYTVNVLADSAGAPSSKIQQLNLNISAPGAAADLRVTAAKTLNPPSGGATFPVSFTLTVQNLTMGSNVAAMLWVGFSSSAQLGGLPAGCTAGANNSVACNFSSVNGSPAPFLFPVNAAFAQPAVLNAVVTSAAADATPNDNNATSTAYIPPRPFLRKPMLRFP